MNVDYNAQLIAEMDAAFSPSSDGTVTAAADSFCDAWHKFRGVAVAAQGILNILFPAGAKILGLLIQLADSQCGQS